MKKPTKSGSRITRSKPKEFVPFSIQINTPAEAVAAWSLLCEPLANTAKHFERHAKGVTFEQAVNEDAVYLIWSDLDDELKSQGYIKE